MHLDPDFNHLTYGDHRERAKQLRAHLGREDLVVFYAGLNNVGIGTQQGSANRLFTKGIDSTSSNNAFLCQNSNGSNLMYVRNDDTLVALDLK